MSVQELSPTVATKPVFLKTAENIGKKLAKEAIWSPEGYCNWQGASLDAVKGQYAVVQRTFKADLYSGLSGIALFFSELYGQIQQPIFLTVLNGTVNNILQQHKNEPLTSHFSFFGGQLGTGYTLWRLGLKLNNADWKAQGMTILKSLKDHDLAPTEIDIIGGAAGAIPVLTGIYQTEKDPDLLTAAVKCGEFLIEKAEKNGQGWFWKSIGAEHGLTGYSHGSAGIANGLLDLFAVTGEERFKEAAMKGFQFERKHYVPHLKNWPDLRSIMATGNGNAPTCCEMWCHGAPGMVLSRLKAFQQTQDQTLFEDAKNAVETTYQSVSKELQNPSLGNFSLCHGLAGNADILLAAGTMTNNVAFQQIAEQVGLVGAELYDKTNTDWPSGVNDPTGKTQGKAATPGLMLGLAGTGYFYLRLVDNTIPSMMLL